jgi:hypothetical protein
LHYAAAGGEVEQPVDGYVVDVVRDGLLIEIQTRGFSALKRKLSSLISEHSVLLVHPIPTTRWLVKVDEAGEILTRRRSPKHGSAVDLFAELVSFPQLIDHPNFVIEVVLTSEEEILRQDGTRARRRKGWVSQSRHLLEIHDTVRFESSANLASMLPDDLDEPFTTASLAAAIGRPRRLAQQIAYCLRSTDTIQIVGKTGNTLQYVRT